MGRKFYRDLFTGRLTERDYDETVTGTRAERTKKVGGQKWPKMPEAMGIDTQDIPATEARLAQKGIPTKYNRHGCPIVESPAHYRKICKELGFYARNGGYSDPQPYNR